MLINNVQSGKIRENLRAFTIDPHPAGTKENNKVADKISEIWRQNGLQGSFISIYLSKIFSFRCSFYYIQCTFKLP